MPDLDNQKERGKNKLAKIPIKIVHSDPPIKKPSWMKIRLTHNPNVEQLKSKLRKKQTRHCMRGSILS